MFPVLVNAQISSNSNISSWPLGELCKYTTHPTEGQRVRAEVSSRGEVCREDLRAQYQQALQELNFETARNYASPRFDLIRQKLPLDVKKATLQNLSDTSIPNQSEKKVLEEFNKLTKSYKEKELALISQHYPYIVDVRQEFYGAMEKILLELYSGKLNFGEYNKKRIAIADAFRFNVDRLNAEKSRLREAAQVEQRQSSQREALCTQLRKQLQSRYSTRNSLANRLADSQAYFSGTGAEQAGAINARAQQRERFDAETSSLEQKIISTCGSL